MHASQQRSHIILNTVTLKTDPSCSEMCQIVPNRRNEILGINCRIVYLHNSIN